MRALTLLFPLIFFSSLHTSRNEVLAREGIDTLSSFPELDNFSDVEMRY